MKIRWKPLLICLAIPLISGTLVGLATSGSMGIFEAVKKPPFSPPGWLFPIVWIILYAAMGVSLYLIETSDISRFSRRSVRCIWGLQLLFNLLWPVFFFSLQSYGFAFIWLVLLWILILRMALLFYYLSPTAAFLQLPYLLWVTFAAYLNLGIWILNR